MDKKNQVLLTAIAVATLLVAVVGATFAYFSAIVVENNKTETRLRSAELGITFTGTQEITTDCSNGTATDDTNTTIEEVNGHRTYNCVNGASWEPGSSAQKIFTVENTSDYDMTFDINFTKVVNNFSRTQDLTYSIAATYVEGANGETHSGSVQKVANDAVGVSGVTQTAFSASGTMPTDNTSSVDTSTATPTITYGTNTTQVVRVFIPAHAKEQFTMTVAYADAVDPTTNEPINQNEDQGKVFRATVTVTSNGIDQGTLRN